MSVTWGTQCSMFQHTDRHIRDRQDYCRHSDGRWSCCTTTFVYPLQKIWSLEVLHVHVRTRWVSFLYFGVIWRKLIYGESRGMQKEINTLYFNVLSSYHEEKHRNLSYWPCDTLYPQKLALISPTSSGRLVGIVCLQTKTTELVSLVS
jgi:hypothetical protein